MDQGKVEHPNFPEEEWKYEEKLNGWEMRATSFRSHDDEHEDDQFLSTTTTMVEE